MVSVNKDLPGKFSIHSRLRSFGYAWAGLRQAFKAEPNFRIHVCGSLMAISLGLFFKISMLEWLMVLVACGMVWTAELFNSVIEKMLDYLAPERHEKIRNIKDMSAAAVFIAAVVAFLIGILIFLPKIFLYVQSFSA